MQATTSISEIWSYFRRNVPGLLEVSIGHALVCDAIYIGLVPDSEVLVGATKLKYLKLTDYTLYDILILFFV